MGHRLQTAAASGCHFRPRILGPLQVSTQLKSRTSLIRTNLFGGTLNLGTAVPSGTHRPRLALRTSASAPTHPSLIRVDPCSAERAARSKRCPSASACPDLPFGPSARASARTNLIRVSPVRRSGQRQPRVLLGTFSPACHFWLPRLAWRPRTVTTSHIVCRQSYGVALLRPLSQLSPREKTRTHGEH